MAMVAAGQVTVPALAAPAPAPGKKTPAGVTLPRPADKVANHAAQAAALAAAKKQKKPVEVQSLTTETTTTFAQPDGRLVTDVYAGAVQIKQADGSWAKIDTTLVESEGVLVPKVAKADVRFSAGGRGPFAQARRDGGKSIALLWPSRLPEPQLKGNTAVYQGAAGAKGDLAATALPSGMRFDVVLRERATEPVEFRIPLELNGLSAESGEDGRLLFARDKKERIASLDTPAMWGAGPASQAAGSLGRHGGRGRAGAVTAKLDASGKNKVLVLKPDASFLADPATSYPVTISSVFSTVPTADTDVYSLGDWNNADSEYLKAGTESSGGSPVPI
ncbi:hypothetical protein [Streptosporangium pseudovulgare]|uniref:hypothetical protein n=1 Tax=Streptosporangium pseudovulgare TaxID=35765 RepID=UPI00167111DA|nr:hypothetical protein [Streptosporangium pseudovulgare]